MARDLDKGFFKQPPTLVMLMRNVEYEVVTCAIGCSADLTERLGQVILQMGKHRLQKLGFPSINW